MHEPEPPPELREHGRGGRRRSEWEEGPRQRQRTVRVSARFVPPARPAIRIVKGPNSQRTGYEETARFRITVTNTGNVRLRNVRVADPTRQAATAAWVHWPPAHRRPTSARGRT